VGCLKEKKNDIFERKTKVTYPEALGSVPLLSKKMMKIIKKIEI
jgi:hypothetical protein